jgi:hypothetical protein
MAKAPAMPFFYAPSAAEVVTMALGRAESN